MTSGQLKGSLLEYLVKKLLLNCGFTYVKPDGHYIWAQNGTGLFYINGKGAAHDADVLMEPPIQIPFSYPSRLLFECKAYNSNVGLNVIRNALGLRYDINEFEIITDKSIEQRKNNKRASYAISDRKRFNYQVGVASVELFSASAIEFAANNKIPLLSMRWFLSDTVCDLFTLINSGYLKNISNKIQQELYRIFKFKDPTNLYMESEIEDFLESDEIIGKIIKDFNQVINRSYIGLIETGDLIFLITEDKRNSNILDHQRSFDSLQAKIHYYKEEPNTWLLNLRDSDINVNFKFFVPDSIMQMWKNYSLDKNVAIDLKEQFFSRMFIFTQRQRSNRLPFILANINKDWLERIKE